MALKNNWVDKVNEVDIASADDINQVANAVIELEKGKLPFVTPQMFGAKADGVKDDTAEVQAALNAGGLIYFPAGRYKVTSKLVAEKSCRIVMFKQYPSSFKTQLEQPIKQDNMGDYPLNEDDNWMGARIETYSEDVGLVLGASVEVDGLNIRAMRGFGGAQKNSENSDGGILLKYDETVGKFNYPATVKISHVRLDIADIETKPSVMFDFCPVASFNYFLEDINIGRRAQVACKYGFRADLSLMEPDSNDKIIWANNVYIRGLCIDLFADYPLYVDGSLRASPWLFDGLAIQTYAYHTLNSETGLPYEDDGHLLEIATKHGSKMHENIITLKNMQDTTFLSSAIWDAYRADIAKDTDGIAKIFVTDNVENTSCIGCSPDFEVIESALANQLSLKKNSTIKNLDFVAKTDSATGEHEITLSDRVGNIKRVTIPGAALSDTQVNKAVGKWMDENSVPYEVVGRNKANVFSDDFVIGYAISEKNGSLSPNANMATTNYIEAEYGDVVQMSLDKTVIGGYSMAFYDKDEKLLGGQKISGLHSVTIAIDGTKFVRISFSKGAVSPPGNVIDTIFDDLKAGELKFCITVNNTGEVEYTQYEVHIEGGLGEYIILQAPNGTRYELAVNNDGTIVGAPVS